jgi:16S rRNA A1518/A1519 N6-dimethyltransferase RsmA/KsgA/DIM1 with predicted DNA glycosylase/AP lyase activity
MSHQKEATISNPFIDWQLAFDTIPDKDQITVIELGWGEGTKYLLDNFKKVISIELSRYTYPYTPIENHTYIELQPEKNTLTKDDVLIETLGKDRPEFQSEIKKLMTEIKKHKADFVFVDFGFHFRSEVVQELIDLNQYAFIAYHDSNFSYYGYDNLDCKKYKKIEDKMGQGTVILSK